MDSRQQSHVTLQCLQPVQGSRAPGLAHPPTHTHGCDRATLVFHTILECPELEGTHKNIDSKCWPLFSVPAGSAGRCRGCGCPQGERPSRGPAAARAPSLPSSSRAEPRWLPTPLDWCCGGGFYSSFTKTASAGESVCLQLPAQALPLPHEVSPSQRDGGVPSWGQ